MLIHSGAHRLRTASNSSRMRSALRSENRRSPSSAGTKGGVTLLPHSVARAAADASSAAPRVPSTLAPPSMRHQPRGLAALRQRTDSTQHCSGLPVKLPWCIATIVLTQLFVHVKNKQKIDASSQGSSRLSRSRILALSWDSHPPATQRRAAQPTPRSKHGCFQCTQRRTHTVCGTWHLAGFRAMSFTHREGGESKTPSAAAQTSPLHARTWGCFTVVTAAVHVVAAAIVGVVCGCVAVWLCPRVSQCVVCDNKWLLVQHTVAMTKKAATGKTQTTSTSSAMNQNARCTKPWPASATSLWCLGFLRNPCTRCWSTNTATTSRPSACWWRSYPAVKHRDNTTCLCAAPIARAHAWIPQRTRLSKRCPLRPPGIRRSAGLLRTDLRVSHPPPWLILSRVITKTREGLHAWFRPQVGRPEHARPLVPAPLAP